jgi:hypothetical protein
MAKIAKSERTKQRARQTKTYALTKTQKSTPKPKYMVAARSVLESSTPCFVPFVDAVTAKVALHVV